VIYPSFQERREEQKGFLQCRSRQYVGSTVAQLVSVLDPHAVIVGGGLGSATGLYWQTLQESVRQHIWSDAHRQLPIIQGEYGNRAGVVGAAAAVLHPH